MNLYSAYSKIAFNALVTLVATKENYLHKPFKAIKTVRVPKFMRQRVADCRAGVVERPTVCNSLPDELRNSDSFDGFKPFVKTILFSCY